MLADGSTSSARRSMPASSGLAPTKEAPVCSTTLEIEADVTLLVEGLFEHGFDGVIETVDGRSATLEQSLSGADDAYS